MIQKKKLIEFSSCNSCGRYNKQPDFAFCLVEECGSIYEYTFADNGSGIAIRLCKDCESELKKLLRKGRSNGKKRHINYKPCR